MIKRKLYLISLGIAVLALGVTGLYLAWAAHTETPGERFDRFMAAWTKKCATMNLKPGETTCDILKLKPRNFSQTQLIPVEGQPEPIPEEWVATSEGRLAHSIKIPNPVPRDSGYRPGMTSQQYFEHLCKTEAGEFIYKTVEKVEGLFMMRSRKRATDYELEHLYALEDPFGEIGGEHHSPAEYFVQPHIGRYRFLELPAGDEVHQGTKRYRRFFRDKNAISGKDYQTVIDGKAVFVPYIVGELETKTISSKYGFTWRGIARRQGRDLGIAGSELIVLDLLRIT